MKYLVNYFSVRSLLGTPLGGIRIEDGSSRLLLPGSSTLCIAWKPLFDSLRSKFIEKGSFLDYNDLIDEKKRLRETQEAFNCGVRLKLRNGESEAYFPFLHFRYSEVRSLIVIHCYAVRTDTFFS